MRLLVHVLFFASGVAGLLYEVAWIRVAGTVLGHTTQAVGIVVGVYMGGMALGGLLGGRAADRRSGASLLRLYAILEAGVAVSALCVPLLIAAADPLFGVLWNAWGDVPSLYTAARVLLMAVVLAVPTTLMGATLPVLARWLSESSASAAGEAGRAYAVNTLGGVVGTLAAGFVLLPGVGIRATTFLAGALNVAVAVAAFGMTRGRRSDASAEPKRDAAGAVPRLPLVVAAVSGMAALVYEVAWTRAIVLALGSTVYAFTLILAVFILGLAVGSALASGRAARSARPAVVLAWLQAGIGASALLMMPFLGDLPLTFAGMLESLKRSYGLLLLAQSGLIALFLSVPTLLMGAVFPFAIRLASPAPEAVGRVVGAVYTANTLGAIVGSLAGTFLLVPRAGLTAAIGVAVAANIVLSSVLLFRAMPRRRAAAAVPAGLLVLAVLLPSWDPYVLSSGVFLYSPSLPKEGRQAVRASLSNDSEIVDLQWDGYGLVTVHKGAQGGLTLRVNGKVDASTGAEDMRTQAFLADLPMLHHPAPRKVLVVGLGAGVTAGTATLYDVERVDCVEISPAVVSAARHFREVNHGCLDNPRLRLRIGDGRQAVRYAREPYDVIICEPSNLWLSGMANLFTRDFFVEASRALTEDGVFCQWIHAYRLGSEDFKAILRTFYDVFPGGSVWEILPGGDYLLLGTRRTAPLAFDAFRGRVEAVAARSPHLRDPFHPPLPGLMSHLVADAAAVRAAAGPGERLTDDRCRVEYTAPFSLYREDRAATLTWLDGLRGGDPESGLYAGVPEEARRPLGARRQSRRAFARAMALYTAPPPAETGPGHYDPRGPDALAAMRSAVDQFGEDAEGRRLLETRSLELMRDAGASAKAGHPDVAARYLRGVPPGVRATLESRLLLGRMLLESRDVAGARRAYEEALAVDGRSYVATTGLASVAGGEGRLDEALRLWAAAAALRPSEAVPWLAQAQIHAQAGRAGEARQACDEALKRGKGASEVKEAAAEILRGIK